MMEMGAYYILKEQSNTAFSIPTLPNKADMTVADYGPVIIWTQSNIWPNNKWFILFNISIYLHIYIALKMLMASLCVHTVHASIY